MKLLSLLFGHKKTHAQKRSGDSKANAVDEPIQKCGGCGSEPLNNIELVYDKKRNRGYLCQPCKTRYEELLMPDSIRNFWMCGACGFRILAGTDIDAKVDELYGRCPNCRADVNESLVNLSGDRAIGRGIIGEPVE